MRHSIRQCQNLATADVATLSTYHLSLAPAADSSSRGRGSKRVFVYDKCYGDAALDMLDALAEALDDVVGSWGCLSPLQFEAEQSY